MFLNSILENKKKKNLKKVQQIAINSYNLEQEKVRKNFLFTFFSKFFTKRDSSLVSKFKSRSKNNLRSQKAVFSKAKQEYLYSKVRHTVFKTYKNNNSLVKTRRRPSFTWNFRFLKIDVKNLANFNKKLKSNLLFNLLFLKKFLNNLAENFHRLLLSFLILGIILFFVYLSFFDTYFLVTNYRIFFAPNSFLAKKETENLLRLFENKKIIGLLPSNQYWFLNEKNLTFIAQQEYPWIQSVRILDRKWPNQISIEIKTQPILVTLRVKENNKEKFWRMGPDGQIWTLDEANLKENLVWVENSINFDKPNFTLQDYPLFKEEKNVNRIYFILTLWEYLKELGIETIITILPNLVDNDVIIQTKNGTKLLFDVEAFDRKSQRERLQVVFNSQIKNQEKNGELAYIDFRITRRIFVCPKVAECADL